LIPYGFCDIEVREPSFSGQFAAQQSIAVFDPRWGNSFAQPEADAVAFQLEIQLAAGGNAESAADRRKDSDLAPIGDGNSRHR